MHELRKLDIGKIAPNYLLGSLSPYWLWDGLMTCFGLWENRAVLVKLKQLPG